MYDGVDLRAAYGFEAVYAPYAMRDKLIFVARQDDQYFVVYDGRRLGPVFDRILIAYCCEPAAYSHTCIFHIPGWPPLAPSAPPGWALAVFGLVWLLVITYLAMLGFSQSHRTPYDRLAGSKVLVKVRQADHPSQERKTPS